MDISDYQKQSARTMPKNLHVEPLLTNVCLGLAGESGEIIEHVKKVVFHGHQLDRDYLKKEIGDVLWYVAAMATALDVDLGEIAQANVDKLKARYPEGFASSASTNRTV